MKYEPYGQVDLKDQWINPWFNLIGWLIASYASGTTIVI